MATSAAGGATVNVGRKGEWAIGEGIFLLVLGVLSLAVSVQGERAAIFALPFLLLLRAVDEFVSSFEGEPFGGVWHMVLAQISMLAAVILLGEPAGPIGEIPPLFFPGGYFLLDGAFRIVAALKARPKKRWTWLLVVGVFSLLLGGIGLVPAFATRSFSCAMLGLAALLSGGAVAGRGMVFRRHEQQRQHLALQR